VVNHVDKTWWRENLDASSSPPLADAPKSPCGTSTGPGDLDKIGTELAKVTRQALSCGRFVVAGIQRVDGVRALKLKRPRSGFVTVVLWIDPATFLPVRSVLTIGPDMIQADLRWLRPTRGTWRPSPCLSRSATTDSRLRTNYQGQLAGGLLLAR
jgi:hypothetical protein